MYAVVESGGKQYKVAKDGVLKVETINANVGENIAFDHVLMIADGEKIDIGSPYLENAKVIGEVLEHGRGKKITIVKFRRRKHHMKKQGHRQNFTKIVIRSIEL